MNVLELINAIQAECSYNEKELAEYLSVKITEIRKWKRQTAVPSKYQIQNLLHFASLYGIDVSCFSWEQYIESVLQIVYEDEYRIDKGIDEKSFTVHLSRTDGCDGYVQIENITNKKMDLFKVK